VLTAIVIGVSVAGKGPGIVRDLVGILVDYRDSSQFVALEEFI